MMIKSIIAKLIHSKYADKLYGSPTDIIEIDVGVVGEPYSLHITQPVMPGEMKSLFDMYWEALGRELKQKLTELEDETRPKGFEDRSPRKGICSVDGLDGK